SHSCGFTLNRRIKRRLHDQHRPAVRGTAAIPVSSWGHLTRGGKTIGTVLTDPAPVDHRSGFRAQQAGHMWARELQALAGGRSLTAQQSEPSRRSISADRPERDLRHVGLLRGSILTMQRAKPDILLVSLL